MRVRHKRPPFRHFPVRMCARSIASPAQDGAFTRGTAVMRTHSGPRKRKGTGVAILGALVCSLALPVSAQNQPTVQDLLQRLEALERRVGDAPTAAAATPAPEVRASALRIAAATRALSSAEKVVTIRRRLPRRQNFRRPLESRRRCLLNQNRRVGCWRLPERLRTPPRPGPARRPGDDSVARAGWRTPWRP